MLREYNKKKIYVIYKVETYCVSCKKNTANKSLSVKNTKQNRLML